MSQRNTNVLIGIVLLTAVTIWVSVSNLQYTIPSGGLNANSPWWASLLFWQGDLQRSIRVHEGLDLVGGTQLVLEAQQPENAGDQPVDYSGVIEAARVVIENRVSGGLGVVEPLVQVEGTDRIIVELPEVKDPDQAVNLVKETGRLEFVEALRTPLPAGIRILTSEAVKLAGGEPLTATQAYSMPDHIFPTIMTGAHLEDAAVAADPTTGARVIAFTLTDEGRDIFSEYTKNHIGDIVAITLDGVVVSAPRIQTHIDTKNGQITSGSPGGFDRQEAEDIAIKLKYGALPVPLKVVENRTVGPSLGQESLQRSLRAGTIGIIVVLLFMLIYYRVPGVFAALAMALYGLINFSLYKLIPVTLTVPAITGFILSIGMAVDANILVFERMKEEFRAGRRIRSAVESGFTRAWPSIRDANLSTLITCVILFWFGSNFGASIVKGFATTLAIGVLVNLFTAITVTRAFLRLAVDLFGNSMENNSALWIGLKREAGSEARVPQWARGAFQIVQKRRWFYILSASVVVPGLIFMGISMSRFGSPLRLSIDYTGGTLWEMAFEQPVSALDVRQVFVEAGYSGTTAQAVEGENTVLVRTKDLNVDEKTALEQTIREKFGNFSERRFQSIGPKSGGEVTQASGTAVAAASVAILLFIWYVFRAVPNAFRYGFSAIVAMLHDVLVTVGLYALAGLVWGWEVDTLFLTAVLTVIGYSVNDTIVVFDRLRENLPRRRGEPFEVVANRSLLETLHRSLATSISTLFVVGAVLWLGGATTKQFMAVMFVGIFSGAYSSIFNAVPLLVSWQKGEFRRLFGRGAPKARVAG
ncbi:MAG: protein translocase subunit SecD [Caldilineae bacterium]|nr:MAG: protein translocase subunit SecD [Caldilineae bacterium]